MICNKNAKMFLSLILSCAISFTLFTPSFAAEASGGLDDTQLLITNGFRTETTTALNSADRTEIVNTLKKSPKLVEINTSVMQVDKLSEVEQFCAATDDQLISMGAKKNEILKQRKEIDDIFSLSDEGIAKKLDISDVEAKLLKKAIKMGKSKAKLEQNQVNDDVVASGSISSSQLSFTQATVNKSTATAPDYRVTVTYSWSYPYLLGVFTDQIVFAWGGGLNTKNISGTLHYLSINNFSTAWTSDSVGSMPVSYLSRYENPNTSIQFYIDQVYSSMKTCDGNISFNLYQLKKQGYSTKVVSQYLHRVIGLSASVDISVAGAAVTVTPVGSWDTSEQATNTISY